MALHHNPRIVTDGLVLHLDAADKNSYPGTGTVWNDLSGNGNNGTLVNGPTFNSGNGGSIVFDGVNDYVNIPASSNLNITGSLTVSMFCKSEDVSTTGWNIFWAGVSKYSQFILGPNNPGGKMAFIVFSGTWYPLNYSSTVWGQTNINPRDYHLYTGTYDYSSGILRLYVDTNIEAEFNIGSRILSEDLNSFSIGKRDVSANFLKMTLGVTSIYNRALTATEILQNYLAQKSRFNI